MPMEMEKRRLKGRSFLSFFDWNSKSHKKLLFDNPNNLPEVSNQGKENVGNKAQAQMNKIKVGDNGASPGNVAASCDFNCALSISSDEGCETKAPGLVARLMGLDSLPASTVPETSSTSLYGSNSLGSSHCQDGSLHCMVDSCPVDCTNMPLKLEKSSSGAMKPKAQKVGNLPALRRFQNETLPPKSAKPIPVTHNKLLSPIKNPGYVQPRNVAQIMDAATKIIEASPLQYARNGMPSVGPSSVPLRILDLKEQLEGAQYESKLVNRHIVNHVNGKPNERSNLYKGTLTFKRLGDSEKNSSSYLGNKGKSASVVIPSKADVQNRDTSALKGKKGHMNPKEDSNTKPNQPSRSQKKQFTDLARAIPQRAFTGQNSNVLGQNNINHKGKLTSKRESNKPTTRTWSSESSTAARKAANKGAVNGNTEPNRSSIRVIDSRKETTVSKRQSISEKKKYTSRVVHNDTRGTENVVDNFENRSIKCNITTDRSTNQNAVSMSESKDVISFTFTSPLGRTMLESQHSTAQLTGTSNRVHANTHACHPKKLSSTLVLDSDTIDGDTLSVLLEKMLQELPSRINSPQCTLISDESSSGSCNMQDNGWTSSDNPVLTMNQQLQTTDPIEEPSCGSSESGNDIGPQHSGGAVRLFENPTAVESYLDCEYSIFGRTLYPSIQDEEVSNFSPWSEQSSVVTEEISNVIGFRRSKEMELEYIKDILSAELMAEEFVIGETNKIIMPNQFDILEIRNVENYIEYSKLERKVLFDTVSDCLELRYRKAFVGSCKVWPELVASVQKRILLAEELLKEIISFRSMEEVVMVDELVHKDMSIGLGRWIDFDIEAFEEGLDVEFDIVTNLINELVYELMIG